MALFSLIQNWLTTEGFRSLVALVGTNGQGVGTSSLSEWVKKVSALSLGPPDKQALDVFINKLYDDLEEGDYYHVSLRHSLSL